MSQSEGSESDSEETDRKRVFLKSNAAVEAEMPQAGTVIARSSSTAASAQPVEGRAPALRRSRSTSAQPKSGTTAAASARRNHSEGLEVKRETAVQQENTIEVAEGARCGCIPLVQKDKGTTKDDFINKEVPTARVRLASRSRGPNRDWKYRGPPPSAASAHRGRGKLRCPHRIHEAHEVHPADEVDFVKSQARKDDRNDTLNLREVRNKMIKEVLQEEKSVQFVSGGNSLWPKVHAGDCCLFEPTSSESDLKVDDIVFCQVQPNLRYFAHPITNIEKDHEGQFRYTISNLQGIVNGFAFKEHIYGRLFEVLSMEKS